MPADRGLILDLGLSASRDWLGGFGDLSWSPAEQIEVFARGELGRSWDVDRWDWLAIGGLRFRYGKRNQ